MHHHHKRQFSKQDYSYTNTCHNIFTEKCSLLYNCASRAAQLFIVKESLFALRLYTDLRLELLITRGNDKL